jgi:predicted GIY-YIG superfamily endonuclease
MYKIYLIANIKNKKQYVGITKFSIEERFSQHVKRGFLLTEAIQKYGPIKGIYLGVKRLSKCRPGGGHGYDPVP